MSAVTFSMNGLWKRYFLKNWACDNFSRKYCTFIDGSQTYDFIADKSCLLFSIILKVLGGSEKQSEHREDV